MSLPRINPQISLLKSPGLLPRSAPIDFHCSADPCGQIPLAETPTRVSCTGLAPHDIRCCPPRGAPTLQTANSTPIVHSLTEAYAVPRHLIPRVLITRLPVQDGKTPSSPYLPMQRLDAPPSSIAHGNSYTETHSL